ncbi:unnamed protein product [Bursaphelenchus xylophilus]|uniref:(pine wood nematode) hypothetical protein n=1 Tax=Bursaphelenchus xylophilus TaxID=6326 RepID=A0A1I7SL11_BURXY|nr:unnamed protein product [Bursaphelenchus xylophilus]CAG9129329.1 unnamed protein product [Bursaphelenchus xylophilus]
MVDAETVVHTFTVITQVLMLYVLFLSFYFNRKLNQTSLIHPNLKIILRNIGIIFPIINIARFISYGWAIIMDKELLPPIQANVICLLPRFVEEVGLGCCATLISQITIERTIATLKRKTYERHGVKLGWMITGQTFMSAVLFSIAPIVYDIFIGGAFDLRKKYIGCRLDQFHVFMYLMIFVCAFGCSVMSFVTLTLVYLYCKRQLVQMREMKLSTRYQYTENIESIKALLPSMLFYVITASFGVYVTIVVYLRYWKDEEMRAHRMVVEAYIQILHVVAQLYAIATMSYFLLSFRPLRAEVYHDLHSLCPKMVIEPEDAEKRADAVRKTENVDYFTLLSKTWQ